ncbi:hypothetical protein HDU98_001695 [Podochytrium sp. JEL0797]|nr:hypothetical protein HDU98_001695 [Podochytrium sp. JEL0797]
MNKTTTVAELKQALQVELKDDQISLHHAVITSGGRKWIDANRLLEMDPEKKGVVKLSCALLSVDTNKKYIKMGESRTELLAWLNDLCQVNYTKIEQCGTGAVYCAVMDSIYNDVPLSKVKFNAKQEYEYVGNYKILQNSFDKHKVENNIPVDRLMKCKFQDNIEFMQMLKKFWDSNFHGGQYDALARRGASAAAAKHAAPAPIRKSAAPSTTMRTAIAPAAFGASKTNASSAADAKLVAELKSQNEELKDTVGQVEKERDFYFSKLREIEMYVSQVLDENSVVGKDSMLYIQNIMYKTEEGFEPPVAEEAETF